MLFTKKFYGMLLGVTMLSGLFCTQVQAAPVALSDIEGNWAQKSIENLAKQGAVAGYPDGTFKPDQAVSRAEFAKMTAALLNYSDTGSNSLPDVGGHWASSYINKVAAQKVMSTFADGTFKPDGNVSRAQLAVFMTRALHIVTTEEKYTDPWPASFTDLDTKHWAFRSAEVDNKLGILPEAFQPMFKPDQAVTRAEAAWTLNALNQLSVKKGKIATVDPDTGLVNIQGNSGDPLLAMIAPETILMRNNTTAPIDSMLSGDEITVISAANGDVKYTKAFGKVTKNDILSRVSSMTKGQLTPDQISAIATGDWSTVKDGVKGNIFNRLISMGLTAGEAESLINQDWNYLDTVSKDRLSQALSAQFGITQDFSQALLDRDMKKIQDYGKVELATAALSRLLGAQAGTDSSSY